MTNAVFSDLAIVGAGPAGVAAALAARAAGLSVTLLEAAARPGGQLHRIHSRVTGVPAFEGEGAGLAHELARQLADAALEPRFGTAVEGLVVADGAGGDAGSSAAHATVGEAGESAAAAARAPGLRLAGGEQLRARAVLIASGLKPRTLGVKGEREFTGAGVSTSATRDRANFAGRPVVVVGGGDAAFENALLLAEAGCRVTLVARGEPRARDEFRRRSAAQPAIELVTGARVIEILGDSRVTAVRLAGPRAEFQIETSGVFVKIGSSPNTGWCRGEIRCDAEGYVLVDTRGATSSPGIWAAGDVARPAAFTVAAAFTNAAAVIQAVRAAIR